MSGRTRSCFAFTRNLRSRSGFSLHRVMLSHPRLVAVQARYARFSPHRPTILALMKQLWAQRVSAALAQGTNNSDGRTNKLVEGDAAVGCICRWLVGIQRGRARFADSGPGDGRRFLGPVASG